MGKGKRHIRGRRGAERAAQLKGVDLERVVVVAIDSARDFPKALVCNYFGEVLGTPFYFGVNFEGILELHMRIQDWVRRRQASCVLVGIEVAGTYHEDISNALGQLGYEVALVSPFVTAQERRELMKRSKTDDIDLEAIAQAVIEGKGLHRARHTGPAWLLRTQCRARRREVERAADLRKEIRQTMTMLWREYEGLVDTAGGQPRKRPIFGDFWNQSSRLVLRHCPVPAEVRALGPGGLAELARRHGLRLAKHRMELLWDAAERALLRDEAETAFLKAQLWSQLDLLESIERRIEELGLEIEALCAETPAVLWLTAKGIGVVTAAELWAELGSALNFTHARQWIKLAGTDPVWSESGGKRGRGYTISYQGNPALRRVTMMIGCNLARPRCGNGYFLAYAARLAAAGKAPLQIYIAVGNKFLRVGFAMLRDRQPFRKPGAIESPAEMARKFKEQAHARRALKMLKELTSTAAQRRGA